MLGRYREISAQTCERGDASRGQSLRSTEAGDREKAAQHKAAVGKGGRKVQGQGIESGRSVREALAVPERAKQEACGRHRDWSWVQATIWTEPMLVALDNGVKGGKWFSLIDKVIRGDTPQRAWADKVCKRLRPGPRRTCWNWSAA